MSKAMLSPSLVSMILVAALAAGCGTDEETFQKSDVSKNATRTQPVEVAVTPPAPKVTVNETPAPPRVVTYAEAESAYDARRYDEASDLFARYVELKPGNPWGHYMRGLSAWKAGHLDTAEESLRRAIALDTTHVKSHVNLARVLLDAGRPGEAYTTVDNALALDESSADAWRVKGRVCHDLGRSDEAVAAYQRAIQLDPGDAWSMNNLAYIRIQQERFDEAIGPLARAVELRGDVAVFHNNLGMALERTGHLQAAEESYANAVTADPSNQHAAANGERLAAVVKDPDAAPVDLAQRAQQFTGEMASWTSESLASVVTAPSPVTVSADSTRVAR